MDMSVYTPAFATPDGGDATGVVGALALGRLNGTRRRIAGALADSGQAATAQALQDFSAGKGSAWRPETGLALQAHRNESIPLAALQLAAACAGTGGRGYLDTRLEVPQWLYLDGWLIPMKGFCSLSADGRSINIHSDLDSTAFLASAENRWIPAQDPTGPWTAYASGGLAPRYVAASGLRHSVEGFPWITAAPPLDAVHRLAADPRITAIHQGWRVILEHASLYGSWVACTASGCLLLDPNGNGAAQSGSSYDHPGLIAIEPPACPVFCGELLVHECSHQHLLVYTMVAPVVKPDSDETSYSPIKRARRTMDRVLSGAHAIGNMIIYYALLRRSMELDRASQQRFDQHRTWFAEDYRPALDQSHNLTDAGRALWGSLCRAVDGALEN